MIFKKVLLSLLLLSELALAGASLGEQELNNALQARHTLQQLLSEQASETSPEAAAGLKSAALKAGFEMQRSLVSAAQSGHPVAQFYLAQLVDKQAIGNPKKREEYCQLIDKAAESGLLAAAVVQIYKCDDGFRKQDFGDREHHRMLSRLARMAEAKDANWRWYPLPLFMGMCVPPPERVSIPGSPIPIRPSRMTSYTEFQGEANLLVAILTIPTFGQVDEARSRIQKAQAQDCPGAEAFSEGLEKEIQSLKR